MKKIGLFTFLPLAFAAITSLSSASPLGNKTALNGVRDDAVFHEGFITGAEVSLPENEEYYRVYLTVVGDPDLPVAAEAPNVTVQHIDDPEVNFLDYIVISENGNDHLLRDVIVNNPTYNQYTRNKSFCFQIKKEIGDAYKANRIGGTFSNLSRITIKEGFIIPAYTYGAGKTTTPTFIKSSATSVFSDSREYNGSVVYNVKEEIDLTYVAEQTNVDRKKWYKRDIRGEGEAEPYNFTGLVFGSEEGKNDVGEGPAENANVLFNGLLNGIANGNKIKLNNQYVLGDRPNCTTDKDCVFNVSYWASWYAYEFFVNGTQESLDTIELKAGTILPSYETKTTANLVTANEDTTVDKVKAKIAKVYLVKEDTKFVKNSKGVYIRDHGEDYETTIKDSKIRFVPWDGGSRFLMLDLTKSDYKTLDLKNKGVDASLADQFDFVNHIEYYDANGTLIPHNGSANDTLINYDFGGGNKPNMGIRVKQNGVTEDPFTGVRYIKFKAGMQFPHYGYMAIYLPEDPYTYRFQWSRPDKTAYVLKEDIIFYATDNNNEFVRLLDHVTDVDESTIPSNDLIHNVGKWKPDHSGHAIKNFDQTPETLHFIEGDPQKSNTYGLYFSHNVKDPFVANSASEVRFYLPNNGYKTENKTYIVKSWSFDYCMTDINSVKGTEDGSTYVGNNYSDAHPDTYPSSTTTSYMLQYIADKVDGPGTLAYYCYDANLVADGKWHTCTINQYCPTVYGLNIKLFKFQGEFLVANVKCAIDTHTETLNVVTGQPATCTTDGWKDCYRCSLCGKYFTDQTATTEIVNYETWKTTDGKISKTGHAIALASERLEPTCTVAGHLAYYQCSKCFVYFEDLAGSKEIGDATALTTWLAPGGGGYLAPTGEHTVVPVPGKTPTCTEAGYKACYKCTVCNKYFEEEACTTEITNYDTWKAEGGRGYIAPIAHTTEEVPGKTPTCTEAGYKACYKCTVCNKYFEELSCTTEISNYDTWKAEGGRGYLAPTGHNVTKVDRVEPTCTTPGCLEYYYCSNCKLCYKDSACEQLIGGEAELVAWLITPESEGGGYLAPLGHNLTKIDKVEATCGTAGHLEYYHCTTCDLYFKDAQGQQLIGNKAALDTWLEGEGKIAPLEHDLVFVEEVAATKDKEGVKAHYICSHCGKLFVRDGDSLKEVTEADLVIPKIKGGCGGSVIAGSAIVTAAALGACTLLIVKKKKEKKA